MFKVVCSAEVIMTFSADVEPKTAMEHLVTAELRINEMPVIDLGDKLLGGVRLHLKDPISIMPDTE